MEPVAEVLAGERGGRVGHRGRYGIDGGFAGPTVFGVMEAGLAGTVAWAMRHRKPAVAALAGVGGAAVAGSAASYLYSTGPGKRAIWAQVLDELDLRGDEHVLDVGCGRGAVLMLAARRLPAGRAVGADVWRRRDQSGNSRAATERNAVAEGVRDRVELVDADARDLPFASASFDLVVSSLALSNIRAVGGRAQALREAVRVLRPGGRLRIADDGADRYAAVLRDAGCTDIAVRQLDWRTWYGIPGHHFPLRVDTRPLVPRLRAELTALLASLTDDEWALATACPGWPVHAVAAHLLGVELGNVSVRRDSWKLSPDQGQDPDAWLNRFNQQWVDAARRISPALLIELLDLAGLRFEEHLATLDLDASGGPVGWATGPDPAPVWLDVAREYMERYVHQYQIRAATRRPALGPAFTGPVLTTAAHALPRALDRVTRPLGTVVTFTAEGQGGGTWHVIRAQAGWELGPAHPSRPAACRARTTVDGALKLYIRDPTAPPLTWQGDHELADALAGVKAILG